MRAIVSLRAVVEALDLPGEGWAAYLNRDTAEIVLVSNDDRQLVEDDVDLDELPQWQRDVLPKVREALESDRFLRLPDRYDIHEWHIMERFAEHRPVGRAREDLLDAIHGAGAFRMFRACIRQLGIEDQCYHFRESELQQIAEDWLNAHNIPYR